MKRIFFVIIVLLGITTSCTKNFETFNTDTKRPVVVPAEFVFANAQKALADNEVSSNVNTNVFKLFAQQWTETTYTDEANYDVANRGIANNMFGIYYRDILKDLSNAGSVIDASVPIGAAATIVKGNQLKIISIMEVYVYAQLLEIFGNVPYTAAVDISNIYPQYDDALSAYKDLLARLDEDIAGLDESQGSFGDADLYMQGDVAMWKKFANSMKVRIGITIADGDNATAKAAVESGYAGAFAPDQKCQLVYLDATNSNPIYQDLVQSGRHDFIPSNTIIDYMNNLLDPRIFTYFTPKPFVFKKDANNKIIDTEIPGSGNAFLVYDDGSIVTVTLPFTALAADSSNGFSFFLGGTYGSLSAFGQYSHIADAIQAYDYPSVILDGTEVAFYLAEAAERGYSVGGTAEEYYNKAIVSSFKTWGIPGEVAAYLAKPEVNYATAEGTWRQKIGMQAWLAYHVRGLVAWTTWRRLDYPILNIPPNIDNYDEIPVRFTYPANEATLNPIQLQAASTAIGGDLLTTQLFWDKY